MNTPAAMTKPVTARFLYSWPVALGLLALVSLITLALLWPSVVTLVQVWLGTQTYTHGMIIIPLAIFLAWTRRHDLAQVEPRPWAWGLLWIGAMVMAWVLARSVDVKLIQHFALVFMIPGLVLTLMGPRVAWILVFPLAYLFFAVPFGDFLVPRLQDYTAWFTVLMLQLSGLPVHSDGYYITIPAGNFVVAEACSGVRYLIASVALGLVYAYISYRALWRRMLFIALAIVLPIIANGLRAYGIVMIAHWTNMEHAVGVDHLIYGWVFFGVVMLLLFWLGSLWADRHLIDALHEKSARPRTGYVGVGFFGLVLAATVVLLAVPRSAESWMEDRARQVVVTAAPELPAQISGWQGPEAAPDAWRPQYFDADAELAGVYHSNDDVVELHLFQYLNRGEGSRIGDWRNRIAGSDRHTPWRRSSEGPLRVTLRHGENIAVHETVLRGRGDRLRVVWHWYQVGEHTTTQPVEVKLREAQAILVGDGRGAFLVALATEDTQALEPARERLTRFLRELPLPLGHPHL